MKGQLILAGAMLSLLFAPVTSGASEKLMLRVTPTVSRAPGTLTVRAYVQRDAANRWLRIEADSGLFYRSSEVQLDGATAPTLTEVLLRSLPGGEYAVIATLVDATGQQTVVRRNVIVVSPVGEP